MIDPAEIVSFVTVAEERSFSAAAMRLGLAQSAVSQKIKRLEDQLGLRLLDRTSRRVHLSVEGSAFMPHANELLKAHEDARRAAERIRSQRDSTLRLGGYSFLVEERLKLVEHFFSLHPAARVDVHAGERNELCYRLSNGDLDAVISLAVPGRPHPNLEHILIERRICHIAVPPDHPLAPRQSVVYADLAGCPLVLSPGRQDAEILNIVQYELRSRGMELIGAPEADRRAIEQFAHVRGLPHLRWYPHQRERHEYGGFVVLPILDNVLFTDLMVYLANSPRRPIAEQFGEANRDYVRRHPLVLEDEPVS